MVRHAWSDHWPVLTAGLATFAAGALLLTVVILSSVPVQPAEARIRVTAQATGQTTDWSMTVSNRTTSLMETITRLSASVGQSTQYQTIGDSAYLVETLGQNNDGSGQWEVFVNGQRILDLAAVELQAGDSVEIKRVPTS